MIHPRCAVCDRWGAGPDPDLDYPAYKHGPPVLRDVVANIYPGTVVVGKMFLCDTHQNPEAVELDYFVTRRWVKS